MAMFRHCFNKVNHLIIPREAARNLSSTSVTCKHFCAEWKKSKFGGEWRIKQGKAMDGATYGPLTDLPDYTYLDGRPTPLSTGQLRRREMNKEMAKNVMQMMGELEFIQKTSEEKRQKKKDREIKTKNMLSFKPKGKRSHKSVEEKRSV
ncbi:39S ribosomal protein L52, mitochondrial-like [Pecten maximus]|uniref:39S ribosomal protein L52, mitochondrial-like n=1 Tax=Pecten maximus TaxID=6579 RepID=UPI001458A6A9|nr:39S ribosomal protein L52, mitochondrial-like [Pecten maximus]